MRKAIALATGALMLAAANYGIYQKEGLLNDGRIVFLELAPVDPRSLMQGDYMALRFKTADVIPHHPDAKQDGRIVLKIDARGVGEFARLDDGAALAQDEALLQYRVRGGRPKLATNAFFFQEGTAAAYTNARYGEFRVDPAGAALLTGLRSADLTPLGAPARP